MYVNHALSVCMSPALQADSLPSEPLGKPQHFTSSQQVLKANTEP